MVNIFGPDVDGQYEDEDRLDPTDLVVCDDCKREFPRAEVVTWKPWDFSASSGDEPFVICHGCRRAEKHQERLRLNRETSEAFEASLIQED